MTGTTPTACPCGPPAHPRPVANPPGLGTVAYRVGDYASFRRALLTPRPGETQLAAWRPGAGGDLAAQLVEWWAYLADVLTFYAERVANQAYLRTAFPPENLDRLIRLLGYRPRPGIGATGTLAAVITGPHPVTLPEGFPVQSKPGPGAEPQVFELDRDVTFTPPPAGPAGGATVASGIADVRPAPPAPNFGLGPDQSVRLAGSSSRVKAGDRVLLLPPGTPAPGPAAVATVTAVTHEKDGANKPVTRVALDLGATPPLPSNLAGYRLFHGEESSSVWLYPAKPGAVFDLLSSPRRLQADLAAVVRGLNPGDPVVFEGSGQAEYGAVTGSTEAVWFANPAGYDPAQDPPNLSAVDPAVGPDPRTVGPIPIPHTRLTFTWQRATAPADDMGTRPAYTVRYRWKAVGELVAPPPASPAAATVPAGAAVSLGAAPGSVFPGVVPAVGGADALVEDANGRGATATRTGPAAVTATPAVPLTPPLRALFNLLPVSRGKTVSAEILGSGDGRVAGQDFTLRKSPVTYLQSTDSVSGDNYSSTVRVWVNGIEWSEVRSFYDRPRTAQVFVTREDEQGRTHVVFGDGENGARLPTGVNNVVATYRYGSGAEPPPPGSLTVVLRPRPGLRAVRNPVPVGGGADPDSPSKIRRLAPRSVLAFGRAVSADDYEVIAAQAPGVTRARAAVTFDDQAQRPRVGVWVGDDDGAVTAARKALAAAADPNRLPLVTRATPVTLALALAIAVDPRHDPEAVARAVRRALTDPDAGLFGAHVTDIGEAVYDSQVYAACLAVPGVSSVRSMDLGSADAVPLARVRPIAAKLRKLFPRLPSPAVPPPPPPAGCNRRHDPGPGGYLVLPDDADHLAVSTKEGGP